jgi:hypothetical protein
MLTATKQYQSHCSNDANSAQYMIKSTKMALQRPCNCEKRNIAVILKSTDLRRGLAAAEVIALVV